MKKDQHYLHKSAAKRASLGINWHSGEQREVVFQAPSLNAAYEFARFLRSEGLCKYFRGHRCRHWLPETTLMRSIRAGVMERALEETQHFISWVEECSKACNLHYNTDSLWAIAQHYGYPTLLLDLTTNPAVACTFASPQKKPKSEESEDKKSEECPIGALLLFTDHYLHFLKLVGKDGVELIEIDVSNLWRLEAQCGLFLRLQIPEIWTYSLPDRIEFPHPEDGFENSVAVYPEEKSELELLIDRIKAMAEKDAGRKKLIGDREVINYEPRADAFTGATCRLRGVLELGCDWADEESILHSKLDNNYENIVDAPLRALPNSNDRAYWRFSNGILQPHTSWFSDESLRWLEVRPAKLSENASLVTERVTLTGNINETNQLLIKISEGMLSRTRSLLFDVEAPGLVGEFLGEKELSQLEYRAGNSAGILWDGLRNLPIDDSFFGDLIVRYFVLLWRAMRRYADGFDGSPRRCDSESEYTEVDYRGIGGHFRTGEAPCKQLFAALRDDLWLVVQQAEEWGLEIPDEFPFLSQINYPQYLFDFERFTEVYLRYLLIYEVVESVTLSTSASFFFNPRHVKVFGLH